MPRLPRVHLENVIYFVTLDGPQHEPVFKDPADYRTYMELLGRYKKEYQFKLFSYAFLPGRIYLLLEAGGPYSISQLMQKVTPLYTKYYNAKYNRKGHLFQKRFRSVIIEKAPYKARLIRFLHLLPVEAGLVHDFREYPYTSYAAFGGKAGHANTATLNLSREVQEALKDFPGDTSGNPYEQFMLSADSRELEFLSKKLSRGAVLGSDDFVHEVKKRMEEQAQTKSEPAAEELSLAATASLPGVMTKRLLALSGTLMLAVIVSAYAVSLNLNAQASLSRVNIMPPAVAALAGSKAVLDAQIVSASQPLEHPSPVLAKASSAGTSVKNTVSVWPDLNGTIWDVDLVAASALGEKIFIKDKIRFTGRSFESYYFKVRGFSGTNYTMTVQDNGVITWETIQKNPEGEMVSWRGDWEGDKMEGMLSYHSAGNSPRDFSFMSRGVTQ